MTTTDIIQNIYYGVMLIGVLFLIWKSVQGPQEKSDKADALMAQQLRQLQNDLVTLRDNHLAHLDKKVDDQGSTIRDLLVQLTRLNTIIEERFPKK